MLYNMSLGGDGSAKNSCQSRANRLGKKFEGGYPPRSGRRTRGRQGDPSVARVKWGRPHVTAQQ